MRKLLYGFVFAALFLGFAGTASADHRHYSGCGHNGYGYNRSYASVDYWHNHYYGGRYNRCHYYSGRHHYTFAPVYSAPVYSAPVYPTYWHNQYYRGVNNRCHYYGGRHHYGGYYRPSGFHFGISIFR